MATCDRATERSLKKVCVSGFFDPLHVGHISYMEHARALGDVLIVILNNDAQKRAGLIGAPVQDRKRIMECMRCVTEVIVAVDDDTSVAETLRLIKPHVFAKGLSASDDERKVCVEEDIELITNVGSQLHLQDLIAQSR